MATECGCRIIPVIMTMVDPEQERQRLTELYARMSEEELLKVCDEPQSLSDVALQVLRLVFERRGMDATPFDSEPAADTVEYRELKMIRRYRDLPEALLAKTGLESAGIECFLTDEHIVRIDWFWSNLLGGVKLHVKAEDADAVLEILDQPSQEGFEVEGIGRYDRPRCSSCNSIDIHFEELSRVAFVSAYLLVPIPLHCKGWKCHSCGHHWQEPADV